MMLNARTSATKKLPKDSSIELPKARVTVITPTYNRGELIVNTIESVLAQDFDDYIYIILDDGSTDNTREVVKKMIKGRNNIFYLHHDNMGEAKTVNRGWNISNSEYFLQVNSDDTIDKTLLSELVFALDERPDCVLAYPDFRIVDQGGNVLNEVKNEDWNFIEALSLFSCYAAVPGAVIRKSAFKNLRIIKDTEYKYINDVKMLWDMALSGNFLHVPTSLATWMSHPNGISNDRYKSIPEVLDWAEYYFSKPKLPLEIKKIELTCRHNILKYCSTLIINNTNEDPIVSEFLKKYNESYDASFTTQERYRIEISRLKNTIEHMTDQNLALQDHYESSISWRLTKPLRYVKRQLTGRL